MILLFCLCFSFNYCIGKKRIHLLCDHETKLKLDLELVLSSHLITDINYCRTANCNMFITNSGLKWRFLAITVALL